MELATREMREREERPGRAGERIGGKTRDIPAVDVARFVCALLVVAIHVRPLSTYTELGNFLLDKGLCRIAVPFFFLVSGYFWARKPLTLRSLGAFLWRIALLYALWTAIYYPIVTESQDMNHYWRRCLLSGSYYHLWYYPAMFVAAVLTFAAWKCFAGDGSGKAGKSGRGGESASRGKAGGAVVIVAFLFYFIGCMGESYYGLFAQNARIVELAEAYFALFWSTRSGLFFGFFFFALGVFLQKSRWRMGRPAAAVALAVSLGLMFLEIMTLRRLGVAKDYNLYFALIPATLFLFLFLMGRPEEMDDSGRNGCAAGSWRLWLFLRRSSVLIYGIHLWCKYYGLKYANSVLAGAVGLVDGTLVRMADLFVNNSMAQYGMICAASFLFAVVVLALQRIPILRFLKYLY